MNTESILELSNGQQIKCAGSSWARSLIVGTVRGSKADNLRRYNRMPEDLIPAAVEAEIEACKARWAEKGETYPMTPWVNQGCAVLSDNYPGKDEQLERERQDWLNAPEVVDGQIVRIEGQLWKVKMIGLQYSDPIHFDRA